MADFLLACQYSFWSLIVGVCLMVAGVSFEGEAGTFWAGEEGLEDGRAFTGGDFRGVEEKGWDAGVKTAPV